MQFLTLPKFWEHEETQKGSNFAEVERTWTFVFCHVDGNVDCAIILVYGVGLSHEGFSKIILMSHRIYLNVRKSAGSGVLRLKLKGEKLKNVEGMFR